MQEEQILVPEAVLMYPLTVKRKQVLLLQKLTLNQGPVLMVQLTADRTPKKMKANLRRPKLLKVL